MTLGIEADPLLLTVDVSTSFTRVRSEVLGQSWMSSARKQRASQRASSQSHQKLVVRN